MSKRSEQQQVTGLGRPLSLITAAYFVYRTKLKVCSCLIYTPTATYSSDLHSHQSNENGSTHPHHPPLAVLCPLFMHPRMLYGSHGAATRCSSWRILQESTLASRVLTKDPWLCRAPTRSQHLLQAHRLHLDVEGPYTHSHLVYLHLHPRKAH
jgi:hypothetical protein